MDADEIPLSPDDFLSGELAPPSSEFLDDKFFMISASVDFNRVWKFKRTYVRVFKIFFENYIIWFIYVYVLIVYFGVTVFVKYIIIYC